MVLDQEQREVEVVAQAADQRPQLLDLLVVEAARRLVEQEQLRAGGERTGELDPLLRAVGKLGRLVVREAGEADVLDELARSSARGGRACRRARARAPSSS